MKDRELISFHRPRADLSAVLRAFELAYGIGDPMGLPADLDADTHRVWLRALELEARDSDERRAREAREKGLW